MITRTDPLINALQNYEFSVMYWTFLERKSQIDCVFVLKWDFV